MFKSLRDKLKKSLSIFSKKAEEEVAEEKKEEVVEKEVEQPPVVEEKLEPTPEIKEESVKEEPLPIEKESKEFSVQDFLDEVEQDKEPVIEKPVVEPEPVEKPVESAQDILNEVVKEEPKAVYTEEHERHLEKEGQFPEREERPKDEPLPTTQVEKIVEAQKVEEKPIELPKEEIKKPVEEKPEPTPVIKEEPKEEKKGFFGKLKQALTTKTISADKFDKLFEDLELALLENNVSVEVIDKIKNDLKEELVDKPLPRDVTRKIFETLKKSVDDVLSVESFNLLDRIKEKKPYVIAFFGVNGSGKTTSSAKLAYLLQQQGLSIVFAAADTFRAAAIQQLQEHADKLNVKMISHEYGADAAAVAFDAVKYAQNKNIDVVLIDTAGRLHSNVNLMEELKKVVRVSNPDLKIFVGESITGNDCIEQATKFNEAVEFDGIILTKMDVDEKGGTALSISYVTKKPILFIGSGQEYKDLKPFTKELVLENLGL